MRQAIPRARALDDPQITLMTEDVPTTITGGMPMLRLQANQMLPWPGKRERMARVAERESKVAEARERAVLLDAVTQARNPGLSRKGMEEVFRAFLGVTNVIWLGKGIAGDDTHGHVDDLCRFTGPRTVVLCREGDPKDENHRVLEENRERLESARLEDGSRLDVVPLPMPAPLRFDGIRVPASYANFYVCNAAVLVPTFNDPNDRIALGILSELFRDRPVVGIHAVDLVWGFGTLHCLTQQQPAVAPIRGKGFSAPSS